MFGSDNRHVTRNQGARSCSNISAIKLIRGGSPAGCGRQEKSAITDSEGVLVGGNDTLIGGASQPTSLAFTPPDAYEVDIFWRDDDLSLVQENDSSYHIVDNL